MGSDLTDSDSDAMGGSYMKLDLNNSASPRDEELVEQEADNLSKSGFVYKLFIEDKAGGASLSHQKGFVINPKSRFMFYMDSMQILLSSYYIFTVPFLIAFAKNDAQMSLFIPVWTVDSFFLINILANFFIAYSDEKQILITDKRMIARKYLKGDFLGDAISTFPFELIALLFGLQQRIAVWFRVLKLLRIQAISEYFKGQESDIRNSLVVTGLKKLVFVTGAMIHWLACIWYLCAAVKDISEDTWVFQIRETFPDSRFGHSAHDSRVLNYMVSLYWSFATVSTVGGGPINPQNNLEVICMVLGCALNLTGFAYVLGTMATLIVKKDETMVWKRGEMFKVKQFVENARIAEKSPGLAQELFQHYDLALNNSARGEYEAMFAGLPRNLRSAITRHVCSGLARGYIHFSQCPAEFKMAVASLVHEKFVDSNTEIVKEGSSTRVLYLIHEGEVEVSLKGQVINTLKSGDAFGEVSFLFGIRQPYTVSTGPSTAASVFILERESIRPLFSKFPGAEDKIMHSVLTTTGFDTSRTESSNREGVAQGKHHHQSHSDVVHAAIRAARKKKNQERQVALCWAASRGDKSIVAQALDAGHDVNMADFDGRTPLHLAASEGQQDIVQLLLERGADPKIQDRFKNTPLDDAVRGKHSHVSDVLSAAGSSMAWENDAKHLNEAAAAGDLDQLRLYVDHGVDPTLGDQNGRTPLHVAACEGKIRVIEYLLDKGVEVNPVDEFGGTPLADAIRQKHLVSAEMLRNYGGHLVAETVARDMCQAASQGDLSYINTVISFGVDPNIADYDERTALHLAVSHDRCNVIHSLLYNGAEVNPIDRNGCTPYADAVRLTEGNNLRKALLKAYGGEEEIENVPSLEFPEGWIKDDQRVIKNMTVQDALGVGESNHGVPKLARMPSSLSNATGLLTGRSDLSCDSSPTPPLQRRKSVHSSMVKKASGLVAKQSLRSLSRKSTGWSSRSKGSRTSSHRDATLSFHDRLRDNLEHQQTQIGYSVDSILRQARREILLVREIAEEGSQRILENAKQMSEDVRKITEEDKLMKCFWVIPNSSAHSANAKVVEATATSTMRQILAEASQALGFEVAKLYTMRGIEIHQQDFIIQEDILFGAHAHEDFNSSIEKQPWETSAMPAWGTTHLSDSEEEEGNVKYVGGRRVVNLGFSSATKIFLHVNSAVSHFKKSVMRLRKRKEDEEAKIRRKSKIVFQQQESKSNIVSDMGSSADLNEHLHGDNLLARQI